MDEIKNKDEYNPDIVTLSDDDGKEYTFEVLDAIETDTGRYLIEDDDEYETIADAFVERLEDFFEIDDK